jgi:serine/threonine-protein kinase
MNNLSVEKHNETLRFLINDRLEKELPYTGGYGNYFGLRVDGAQTVSFDQFIVKGTQ